MKSAENSTRPHANPGLRLSIAGDLAAIDAAAWNALLARQATPTPFMRHEYLAALHRSASAVPETGWTPQFVLLHQGPELVAACPLYLKAHSYGEYVFDWSWARAHAEHGIDYYPKALVAVPFTPVPGSRLLARDAATRQTLVQQLVALCADNRLSSLHLLYGDAADQAACRQAGLMLRQQVQFHWRNQHPETGQPFADFDDFLAALSQSRRKNIRQERRKVAQAGVTLRWRRGTDISAADWAFFWRCYERTYLEHGNPPYLQPAFFQAMAQQLAGHWLMFIAERDGQPIAASLIGLDTADTRPQVAYGRYWGALQRVDCLHFELCYHAPLAWCMAHGVQRFEGGAQGEHKMARALLPSPTASAHWLAHPGFARAVERFLTEEDARMQGYVQHLQQRTPFRLKTQPSAQHE